MTIQAQPPDPPPSTAATPELATLQVDSVPVLLDHPFEVLDHRHRTRAVVEPLAPPGRYLAFEGAAPALLVPLDRPITHIGRGVSADLRLEEPRVSRRHAIITLGDDRARVLDDRSSNGTFVNGTRVTAAELRDGDRLTVGPVAMRFVEVKPLWRTVRRRRARIARTAGRGTVPAAA